MSELGEIIGLPSIKEGRTVIIAGPTFEAAAHFAAMTYVTQFVLSPSRVTVNSNDMQVKRIYDAVARGYMKAANLPIKYPIDSAQIKTAWNSIVSTYCTRSIERMDMETQYASNVIVHIPESTRDEKNVVEEAISLNSRITINKTIHLMCLSKEALQRFNIQGMQIIEINDSMSLITVHGIKGQIEGTIPVKYFGGILTNA